MLEIISVVVALTAYLLHESLSPSDKYLVAPLVLLLLAIGLKSPFKVIKSRGFHAAIKTIVADPRNIFLTAASIQYGLSYITITYLPATYFELAIVRPSLYQRIQQQVLPALFWTVIAVSIISLVTQYASSLKRRKRSDEFNRLASIRNIRYRISYLISYRKLIFFFLFLNISSLGIRVYAYRSGWTNLIAEGGYADIFGSFATIASIISGFSFFLPAAWLAIYFQSKHRTALVLVIISWTFEASYGALYGQKAAIVLASLGILFCIFFYAKKLPIWRTTAVTGLTLLLATIAIGARSAAFSGVVAGDVGIVKFTSLSIQNGFESGNSYGTARDLPLEAYLLSRFNIAVPFLATISLEEDTGPKYDAGPYINILLALVPSFIFPYKPKPFDPNEFGRDVGLLNEGDYSTSVRPSYFGDLFYNFGGAGVLVGSFILAIFLLVLPRTKLSPGLHSIFILYCAFALFDVENSLSNALGGIIKAFVLFYLADKFSTKRKMRRILTSEDSSRRGSKMKCNTLPLGGCWDGKSVQPLDDERT